MEPASAQSVLGEDREFPNSNPDFLFYLCSCRLLNKTRNGKREMAVTDTVLLNSAERSSKGRSTGAEKALPLLTTPDVCGVEMMITFTG